MQMIHLQDKKISNDIPIDNVGGYSSLRLFHFISEPFEVNHYGLYYHVDRSLYAISIDNAIHVIRSVAYELIRDE